MSGDIGTVGDVDERLVRLLEAQTLATTAQRQYDSTAEERRLRQAILAQYGQTTDSEGEDDAEDTGEKLQRNTNAQSVQQAEKEKREQAKLDSQRKKDKDKEDRYTRIYMLLLLVLFLFVTEKNKSSSEKKRKKNVKLKRAKEKGSKFIVMFVLFIII